MDVDIRWTPVEWTPGVGSHTLRQTIRDFAVTPLEIATLYVVVGFFALYISDVILVGIIDDPTLLSQVQAAKGGVEVLATGGLIYALTRRSRRSLRETNDRLHRRRTELQVLHRVLRHNLRNDINLIKGYGASVNESVTGDDEGEWCKELLTAADSIVNYVERTRTINQVAENDRTVDLDLAEAVRSVLDRREDLRWGATVDVSCPSAAPVRAHPMFDHAVEELLDNAVKHNHRDTPVVSVAVEPASGPSGQTTLTVRDNGPGIPDHVQDTLEQREESQLLHLDGLGLWMVSWIVWISNGTLTIENENGGGSVIQITLPKQPTETGVLGRLTWLEGEP